MDIITILQALLRWGIPALAGGAAVLLLLSCAYLIDRKVFRGTRPISARQVICAGLLCVWGILVIGLTTLSRGSNFTGSVNVDFLSGYVSAWNNWSISELQLILFNMLMFTPLGFLLPLLWKRAEKLPVTLAVSLCLTVCLETVQLLTGSGIFELDDLFHNLLGSLFGYFCVMAILSAVREKTLRFAPAARVLLIPCAIGLTLGAVFFVYDRQPYGNMSILPAVKQDLSKIQLVEEWQPSEQRATAPVFKNKYAGDMAYVESVKAGLQALENLTFSPVSRREDENPGYTGTNAEGAPFEMLFFLRSGEWRYTSAGNTAPLTEERAEALRKRYEDWMLELGLLPEDAVFSVQNGDTLRWDAGSSQAYSFEPEAYQRGSVMMQFDESGALLSLYYLIDWNEYAATESLLSESDAYAQVQQGNFQQYVPFQEGDVLHVNGCELLYVYDTKGFYQPAYQFSGYLNDEENLWTCQIPALQK